ncbi:imm11 family protein, partial [Stenotrophomonas sp. NPDC077659]|uniref:imm11 family protein n=1 Tax=Stenotrophomonas sp. NPDC077659 TaxID=3390694 RepID=UPI003D06A915
VENVDCGASRGDWYFSSLLDAIDESASSVRVLQNGYPNGKFYDIAGGASLAFREDVVAGSHVFRTPFTADVYCDRVLRDALIESGYGVEPATRGVWPTDAADLFSVTA